MKIVILDAHTTNPGDLSWEGLNQFGELIVYPRTRPDQLLERAINADIIIQNKLTFDRSVFEQLPKLKYITLLATGYNNIDTVFARSKGIIVSNVAGYSTHSVAQHTIALMLELVIRVQHHHDSVVNGDWKKYPDFSYCLHSIPSLHAKTLGLYGYGNIAKQVGRIAEAFGMHVIAFRRSGRSGMDEFVEFTEPDILLRESDFLSLHAPLNDSSIEFINARSLGMMKPTAYLINTARGGLINEVALAEALDNNIIAGAALDVLSKEPPVENNPMLKKRANCIVTPHIAWSSIASRKKLIEETVNNVAAFIRGENRNVVN